MKAFGPPNGYTGRMTNLPQVDLVGVGLNATDTQIVLAAFPERGSKVQYSEARVLPGGQVATAVVACQQWGMSTRYVGIVGDDSAGKLHRDAFARAGVEAQIIAVPGGVSPQSLILVDGDAERTVLYRRDPRVTLKPADLDRQWIVNARALLVDGYDTAAATEAAEWARAAGIPVIADLDDLYPSVEKLLPNVDYLIVSRDIPCRLMQQPDLETALRQMRRRYGCRLAAATLGENGVLAWNGKDLLHRGAYSVPVVDTTGAGDIFHAGFIYGLLQDWPLDRQLDFACAAAGLNCASAGARGGIHSIQAIEDLMTTGVRNTSADSHCVANSD
jgi:sulfofructose kinase